MVDVVDHNTEALQRADAWQAGIAWLPEHNFVDRLVTFGAEDGAPC